MPDDAVVDFLPDAHTAVIALTHAGRADRGTLRLPEPLRMAPALIPVSGLEYCSVRS
jgi:hypothetical protein